MVAGNSPRLGRCGGNSARLTKCNCLAGCRVQPAPTRYRGGLGSPCLRQQPAPLSGRVQIPEPALTRPGARRKITISKPTLYMLFSILIIFLFI